MGKAAQTPAPGLVEGQTLAGKYLLGRELGSGGMCVVFEAEHLSLNQAIAVKVLKPELATDSDAVTRFEREARAAAQLRSPNVARVFDVDLVPGGQPYITMELLVGHDLGTELTNSGRLPIPLAVDYVRQACTGMAEAHALGIVHRDLKPENLFLTDLGELTDRKLVKVLDFGIAKNVAESARRLTAPDAVFGTVDYMSPEQIRSASKVDHRSDIWALGVILYELLTGRLPYSGDARSVIAQIASDPITPPTAWVPDLPPSLVATVTKALAKDPAARFQSAEELRDALEGYGDFEPITAVIARLPPQSVPRRPGGGRSLPPSAPAAGSAGGGVVVPPAPPLPREHRSTHASWESRSERRGFDRRWLFAPLLLGALGGTAGVLAWRAVRHPTITALASTAALAPAAPVASTAPSATAAPATAEPAASGGAASASVAPPGDATSSVASPSAATSSATSPGPSAASSSATSPGPSAASSSTAPRHPKGTRPKAQPTSTSTTPRTPKHL